MMPCDEYPFNSPALTVVLINSAFYTQSGLQVQILLYCRIKLLVDILGK